jgi:hypothetical protein
MQRLFPAVSAIILAALVMMTGGPALAQGGDPALPACTPGDYAPIAAVAIGMLDMINRQDTLEVDALLDWRAEIGALEVPACAEATDIILQLQLANDELLIGALLLERSGGLSDADTTSTAATAINAGLTGLAGLRFQLSGSASNAPNAPTAIPLLTPVDVDAVLTAFEAAALPYADLTRDADPVGGDAPQTPTERITFMLPDIFDGGMGQLLVFADADGRDAWLTYLYGNNVTDPGYVYVHRNIILQLSRELDRNTAIRFRAALLSVE